MRMGGRRPSSALWLRVGGAWLAVLVPLALLSALSEDVWHRESFRFDTPTLLWLHAHSTPYLDNAMLWLSRVGGGPLLGMAALWAILLGCCKRGKEALFVALCMVGAGFLNLGAKLFFARARPDLWASLAPQTDYGFPSGHAMLSSAFVGMALIFLWQGTASRFFKLCGIIAGMLFVIGVGVSRLYLGVHFPSDVFAGWFASMAWVALLKVLWLDA